MRPNSPHNPARTPVRAVDDEALRLVRGFLELHADTALFLLSNLQAYGPRLGEGLNSGNFKYIEENGKGDQVRKPHPQSGPA